MKNQQKNQILKIKFPVKIKYVHKIKKRKKKKKKKKNSIGIIFFGYENKKKHPIYKTNVMKTSMLIYY